MKSKGDKVLSDKNKVIAQKFKGFLRTKDDSVFIFTI